MKRISTALLVVLVALLVVSVQLTFSQISGTKTIDNTLPTGGNNYASFTDAITALNTGVGAGGVTFNVTAGQTFTEILPAITATGTSGNPIVFQKSSGVNPIISRTDAGTNATSTLGGLGDAIIRMDGTDYITFNGIDVTASDQGIEYGYLTHKPSGSDGCQNVTIQNCTVTMTKGTSAYVMGVYIGNGASTVSSATGVTVTAESGTNRNITITGNTIKNVHAGIYCRGGTAMYDTTITVGQSGAGNTIQNFGGGSATTTYGVYFIYVTHPSVSYNTIDNAGGGGTSHGSTLYGVFYSTVLGNVVGSNNTITMANSSSASATQYLYNGNTVTSETFNNNTFAAGTLSSTGTVYLIYASNSTTSVTVSGNQTSGTITRTGASGTFYSYYNNGSPTGTETYSGNTISNVELSGTSTFYGYLSTTATGHTQNVYNNTVSNITGGSGIKYGLHMTIAARSVYNNTITGIAGAGTVYGISNGSGNANIYQNSIYNLSSSSTGTTAGLVSGIYISASGTNTNVYNNFISDLRATAATGTDVIRGINCASTSTSSTIGLFYNTIYLNAIGVANFGSSGVFHTYSATATTAVLDMRNNVIINNSTPAGTGLTVAFRRSSATSLANYGSSSNNNDLYAGTPSATNLIFYDGTNADQTLSAFKTRVTPREANSVSENPPFINVATTPYNLHVNTLVATQVESGASPVTTPLSITTDFDGDTRNATTPDMGADEFAGTGADLTAPAITYTALSNTVSTSSRNLTATITDPSGVPTAGIGLPVLYWRINATGTYTGATATSLGSNQYQFSFGTGVVTGDSVQYYIVAQDNASTPNVGSNPSAGAGGFTANPPTAGTPPTNPSQYKILNGISGSFNVGAAETPPYNTLTSAVNDLNVNKILTGPVTFVLTDVSYSASETFPIVIMQNDGASGTNTLTIKPSAAFTNALVTPTISGSSTTSIIKLDGADYVTIDGSVSGGTDRSLTIENTNTGTSSAVIWLSSPTASNGATNNTVKNCIITGNATTTTLMGVYSGGTSIGTATNALSPNSRNTFQNNKVSKTQYGILMRGAGTTQLDTLNSITNSTLGSATAGDGFKNAGVYVFYQAAMTISGNDIQNVTSSANDVNGIYLFDSRLSTVSGNFVHGISYTGTSTSKSQGMFHRTTIFNTAGSPSSNTYFNNAIYEVSGTGTSSYHNTVGIHNNGGYGDKYYFNSVYLTGQMSGGSATGYSACFMNGNTLTSGTSSNIDMRDNALYMNGTSTGAAKLYAHYTTLTSYAGSTLNYNDLLTSVSSPSVGNLGSFNATDYATLAAWQGATGEGANSISSDPLFTANNNLQPQLGSPLLASGTSITGITTDITGFARGTPPTIGAYEQAGPDINGPSITYTALGSTASTANRTLPTTITDGTGVATGAGAPLIYFKKGSSGTWASAIATTIVGSAYTFTINNASIGGVVVGDTVFYYVAAQDVVVPTPNSRTNPAGGSGINPPGSTAPASPNSYVILYSVTSYPYTEDFEPPSANSPQSGGLGWSTGIFSGSVNDWVRGTPAKTQIAGAHSGTYAYVTLVTGNYGNSQNSFVQSPILDFSSLVGSPTLSFWHNFKTETNWDAGILEYSTNGGTTWRRVDSTVGTGGTFNTLNSTGWYNNTSSSGPITPIKWSNTSTAYTGHTSGWINSTTKLTGFGGQPDVRLRWRFGSDGTGQDEGWAIDDVSITPQHANDVGPTQIDTPATVHILGLPVSPKAKVKNFGTSANTFNVQLLIHDRFDNLVYDQTQSANVAPDSFFDVFFAVQWTPADTGNHTARVITLLGTDQNRTNDTLNKSFRVTPDSRTNLTPDGGGYKYSASNSSQTPRPNYTWSNAGPTAQNSPTVGTLVPGTQDDDFLSAVLVLPTPFTFYGLACDSIRISTNGWIAFTDTATGNHTLGTSSFATEALIPNTAAPNYFIAALWDDLDTVSSVPTAGVYFMDNVGATGEYVIEWFHFKKWNTSDANDMLFQIVLNFNNNSVRITYAAAGDGGFNYNQTAQGSVGIEGNGSATLAPTSLRSMFGEIDGKAADTKSDPEILARLLQGGLNETPGSPAQVGPQGSNYYFQDDKPYSAPTQGVTIVFSDQEANLPIQLAYLSATRINNGQSVRVAWGTLSEINNFGFWVEKAQNLPLNFQTIPNSFVEGHGTTNEPQHYVFIDQNVSSGAWYYRLKQQDLDGTVHYSDPVRVELTTSVIEVAPKVFSLLQNYPNPFNPATEIKFSVENTARATLEIYNVLGQKVATLFDDIAEAGQYYRVRLNASSFATGLYVYRLQSGTRTAVKKMLLLK